MNSCACLRVDCAGADATAAAGPKSTSDLQSSSAAVAPQSVNVVCPDGCKKDQCLSLSGGGFWCNECVTGLMLNGSDGTCGCPAGKFSAAGPDQEVKCLDCPKGSFCRGGSFQTALKVPCGEGLTTIGQRASGPSNCGESVAGQHAEEAGYGFSVQPVMQTAAECAWHQTRTIISKL